MTSIMDSTLEQNLSANPTNLYQLLENAASDPSATGLTIYTPGNTAHPGRRITYSSLLDIAKSNARLLNQDNRLKPSSPVLLHFPSHTDNFEWFWSVVVAGHVPVISTPLTNDSEQRKRHLAHLQTLLKDPLILTIDALVPEFANVENLRIRTIEELRTRTMESTLRSGGTNGSLREMLKAPNEARLEQFLEKMPQETIVALEEVTVSSDEEMASGSSDSEHDEKHDDATFTPSTAASTTDSTSPSTVSYPGASKDESELAALMLTSGSTGNAKAVCLRHGQMINAVRGKSAYHGTRSGDTFLNWIGLDHVANLTEIHLHAMSLAAEQIHIQAADLLTRPVTFLDLIDKHRVAYTFAPNFFLASLRRQLEQSNPFEKAVDLSCLRALISGGEVNVVETCDSLTTLLKPHGAPASFIRPGFGMTETCAGSIYGLDCPNYDVTKNHEFTCLGECIPGLSMRISNEGVVAGPDEVGDLELHGSILFNEYYNNEKATSEAFASDGWFMTGDRGRIDANGQLNLVGRAKESIIINGVKYFPHSIETAIVEAKIEGMAPAYTVVFPHRPKGSQTEVMCVVYLPTYHFTDIETRVSIADTISKISTMQCGVRPYRIIPLEQSLLPKSSLGKLSRAKIRTAFETGVYKDYERLNDILIRTYRAQSRQAPSTDTEATILRTFAEMFEVPAEDVGVDASLFEMGATSIELIRFKQMIQDNLGIETEIPIIMVLTNPTIRGLAKALQSLEAPGAATYSPAICLQSEGTKPPLWLVHPGVGEVLVFLNLAKYITDRPVYALRARGFNEGEDFFSDVPEVVSTYHSAIKSIQPSGPYAIAGYSYGSMIAFEVSKVLEGNGDTVGFLGSLNLPPHIKFRMRQLDWTEVMLNLAYFLDLTTEEHAHAISAEMHKLSHEEVLAHLMREAPPQRLQEMLLDKQKLMTWADLAYRMQAIAQDYDPSGMVKTMDVFYAIPLVAVAKSKGEWKEKHLDKWGEFVEEGPRFHEVDGAHYSMLGPEHVLSFSKKIKGALGARGL